MAIDRRLARKGRQYALAALHPWAALAAELARHHAPELARGGWTD